MFLLLAFFSLRVVIVDTRVWSARFGADAERRTITVSILVVARKQTV